MTPDDQLLKPGAFDLFLDPDFRAAAEQTLRAANDRNGLLILEHLCKKVRSGEVEADQKFVAGNVAAAVALWNKIDGRNRTATKLTNGKWLIKLTDCEPYTLDPAELRAGLEQQQQFLLRVSDKPAASPLQ